MIPHHDHDRSGPAAPPAGPPLAPPGWASSPPAGTLPPPPDPPGSAPTATPPGPPSWGGGGPWAAGSKLPPPPAGWASGPPTTPPREPRLGLSIQNLLLGLGTALVGVAALVFTAVNWDRLGATVQGLFLVAATGLAAAVSGVCARRRLPATAESLGLVALVLAVADAHAFRVGLFPRVDVDAYWAGALAVVALAGWSFGAVTGIRSTRIAAAVLAQAPLLLALAAADAGPTTAGLAVLAQVAVVAVLASRGHDLLPEARVAASATATLCAWVVCTQAAVLAAFADGPDRRGPSLVLALGAAVAALVAWLRADDDGLRPLAAGTATLLGLAAATGGLSTVIDAAHLVPAVGLVAAAVVAVGLRVDERWGRVPATLAGLGSAVAALPLLAVASSALVAASEVLPRTWDFEPATRASSLLQDEGLELPGSAVALYLLVLAAILGALVPVLSRRAQALGAGGVVLLAGLVAPLVLPLSVAGAAIVALALAAVTVVAGLATAERPGHLPGAGVLALGPLALALAWSAATPTLTLVSIGASGTLALALALAARDHDQTEVAIAAGAWIVAAGSTGTGLLLLANGASAGACWVAVAGVAAALGLAGVLLLDAEGAAERGDRQLDLALSHAVEAAAWAAHGPALLAVVGLEDRTALSLVLAVGTVAAGLHAARPRRAALGWVAGAHAVALAWLQLAVAGVRAPEPYVLPVAAALLVAGLVADRRARVEGRTLGSWMTLGPALVVAMAPSLVVALSEPGLLRPLLLLAAGTVVLAAGALHGRRAPVDVGTVVVVLLGLRQLGPVVGGLPSWAAIGSAGAFLLAVGATFEQRRRDLHQVRHHYASLT